MKNKTKATWKVESMVDDWEAAIVTEPYDGEICYFPLGGKANAELIVRAVNSHDELLAACKETLENIVEVARIEDNKIVFEFNPKMDAEKIYDNWLKKLDQAITNAEKGD